MDNLSIGVAALKAFSQAVQVTSNNVANADTPGYSQQTAVFRSIGSSGLVGPSGVEISQVKRNYDEYLRSQVNTVQSEFSFNETASTLANQLTNLIGAQSLGLDDAWQNLSTSFDALATNPTSVTARADSMVKLQLVATRANTLATQIDTYHQIANGQVAENVSAFNDKLNQMANINAALNSLNPATANFNELYDQRDQVLKELNEFVKIEVSLDDRGAARVFTATGLSLVNGASTNQLVADLDQYDTNEMRVYVALRDGLVDVTERLKGGKISATLQFREQVLKPIEYELGRMVHSFGAYINAWQSEGYSQIEDSSNPGNALLGDSLYTSLSGMASSNKKNAGAAQISFEINATNPRSASTSPSDEYEQSITELSPASYFVSYDGTNYVITNERTKEITKIASDFSSVASTHADPAPTLENVTATSAQVIIDGLRLTFDNTNGPTQAGDSFRIEPFGFESYRGFGLAPGVTEQSIAASSSPALDDIANSANVNNLKDFQTKKLIDDGRYALPISYSQAITTLGSKASALALNLEASQVKKAQVDQLVSSKSGVNLDEEAANLIRFQQSYQAASQLISTSQNLFDSLLAALR
jgi:flagellar hook-associated protein 1 FlgK